MDINLCIWEEEATVCTGLRMNAQIKELTITAAVLFISRIYTRDLLITIAENIKKKETVAICQYISRQGETYGEIRS